MAFSNWALQGFPNTDSSRSSEKSSELLENQPDSVASRHSGSSLFRYGIRASGLRFDSARTRDSATSGEAFESASPNIEKKMFRLSPEGYFPEAQEKDLIVLHFTAGTSCGSAFRTWQTDQKRIATAYGVEPDGAIVEFFPPQSWAYHLGIKGTHHHDRRSIGIEIANPGPLKKDPRNPQQLNWWPRNWSTRYCDLADEGRYISRTYRGVDYFALMPEAQQAAVAALVQMLCNAFSIPKNASRAARSGDFDPAAFSSYKGVASHSNFRRDKWDVGPAFNWDVLGF